jgi:N6-adenosine-specific RNA methylase IME4
MTIEDIKAMPIADLAAKDCWLILWTTQPHAELAFEVMRAWGFKYSSMFQFWVKLNPRAASAIWLTLQDFFRGMGFTTRKNVEFMILARRGKPKRLDKSIPDLIIAARRQHSRKPDSVPLDIERFCAGPRLELFARESRAGWDSYGNEVDKPFTRTTNRPAKPKAKPAPKKRPSKPTMFPDAEDA